MIMYAGLEVSMCGSYDLCNLVNTQAAFDQLYY